MKILQGWIPLFLATTSCVASVFVGTTPFYLLSQENLASIWLISMFVGVVAVIMALGVVFDINKGGIDHD